LPTCVLEIFGVAVFAVSGAAAVALVAMAVVFAPRMAAVFFDWRQPRPAGNRTPHREWR